MRYSGIKVSQELSEVSTSRVRPISGYRRENRGVKVHLPTHTYNIRSAAVVISPTGTSWFHNNFGCDRISHALNGAFVGVLKGDTATCG